jgi:tetrahydromethanopterin S-methyltransferase subunit A
MCVCIHKKVIRKFWDIFKGEFTLGVKDFSVSQVTLLSHLGLLH